MSKKGVWGKECKKGKIELDVRVKKDMTGNEDEVKISEKEENK